MEEGQATDTRVTDAAGGGVKVEDVVGIVAITVGVAELAVDGPMLCVGVEVTVTTENACPCSCDLDLGTLVYDKRFLVLWTLRAYFAFCTAIEPPTPPPTAAAITTITSTTINQNVCRWRPKICFGGSTPSFLYVGL